MFSVFKHYTYFHILFHPHVFLKNTNNVTRTMLPNCPDIPKQERKSSFFRKLYQTTKNEMTFFYLREFKPMMFAYDDSSLSLNQDTNQFFDVDKD